jgi:putative endonuclease
MAGDPRRALGSCGEAEAARHLERHGYRIIDRNFRTRHGELDLVATGEGCLVFCEVKTRLDEGPFGLFASVGPAKRRQVRRMARVWLGSERATARPRDRELRFDVIGILLDARGRLLRLEHLAGAF